MSAEESKPIGLPEIPKAPTTTRGDVATFTIVAGSAFLFASGGHNVAGIPPGTASVYCGSIALGLKNAIQAGWGYRKQKRQEENARASQARVEAASDVRARAQRLVDFWQKFGHTENDEYKRYKSDLELYDKNILTDKDLDEANTEIIKEFRRWRGRVR